MRYFLPYVFVIPVSASVLLGGVWIFVLPPAVYAALTLVDLACGKVDPRRPPTPHWSNALAGWLWPPVQFALLAWSLVEVAGGRFEPWASDIAALARHGHVACKFSALPNSAPPGAGADVLRPYSDALIAAFGPERLIWASDWPPLLRATDYGTWRRISLALLDGLSSLDRDAVLGGNAARFYRLPS